MSELTIKDKLRIKVLNIVHVKAINGGENHEDCESKTEQIMQLIDSAITEAQQDRIKRNKSFCGCPMCTHHSEPYEAQLKNNTTKQENIKGE